MNAQQKSFMLLPDFSFLPDKEIALGRVLPLSNDTKLPNARRVLPVRLTLTEEQISTQDSKPWVWDSKKAFSTSGGVTADISVLTGVGAGIDFKRGNDAGLKISSKHVRQLTFYPSMEELMQIATDKLVKGILKPMSRPSVFLVTGLLIADGAEIEVKHGIERGGDAHVSADLTSIGAPLNTGVHGGVSKTTSDLNKKTVEGKFLLAYQLLRLRKKAFSKEIEDRLETQHALFSDEVPILGAEELFDLDIDVVDPEKEFEDVSRETEL